MYLLYLLCAVFYLYQHAKHNSLSDDDYHFADIVTDIQKDYELAQGHTAIEGNATI